MKNKSNRFLVSLMGAALALGSWSLSQNVDIAGTQEALAVADTGAISVACTDPTAASFVPDLAYTVTWSAPAAGSAATPSATVALTGAVNSDTAPTVISTHNDGSGYTLVTNTAPLSKFAGLQCQTSTGTAKVEVNGDGNDNASFDIAISNLVDADVSYSSADKVDAVAAASKVVLFGATGFQIALGGIADGTDEDGVTNGEISMGSTTESKGGTEFHSIVDVTNYNVAPGTDVETITLTHTGS